MCTEYQVLSSACRVHVKHSVMLSYLTESSCPSWDRKYYYSGRTQWLTPVIPALWEAEVGESQGQEIETILANMMKPYLYEKNKNQPGLVARACSSSYVGGWGRRTLEPRRSRLQPAVIAPLHSNLGNKSETPSQKKRKAKVKWPSSKTFSKSVSLLEDS